MSDKPIKRVAIEVDRHEMAAIINHHSSMLADVGKWVVHNSADETDLEFAERTASRLQELVKVAQAFTKKPAAIAVTGGTGRDDDGHIGMTP